MFRRQGRGRGPNPLRDPSVINFKNIELLQRYVDEGGRIRSRRRTRVDARNQRKLTNAIKRARYMALLPYTGDHVRLHGSR